MRAAGAATLYKHLLNIESRYSWLWVLCDTQKLLFWLSWAAHSRLSTLIRRSSLFNSPQYWHEEGPACSNVILFDVAELREANVLMLSWRWYSVTIPHRSTFSTMSRNVTEQPLVGLTSALKERVLNGVVPCGLLYVLVLATDFTRARSLKVTDTPSRFCVCL